MAEDAYARLVSLPMFHGMNDQDVEDVIAAVRRCVRLTPYESEIAGALIVYVYPGRLSAAGPKSTFGPFAAKI